MTNKKEEKNEVKEGKEVKEEKQELTLENLPGVGAATAEKLRDAGYTDLISIAVASPGELVQASGLGESSARKVINFCRNHLDMGFESGDQLLKKREQVTKITTGCKSFDNILKGGIETGAITEAYGAYGSGKTTLAHQLAVNVQLPIEKGGANGVAVWIDSEGTLRPEFIKQLAEAKGLDPNKVLKNFRGVRAFNSDHQMLLAEKAEELIREGLPVKLIIIDSLMSHFRSEFCVTPDTLIMGNPKVGRIRDYKTGDKVLSHKGIFRRVLSKQIISYNGDILKINPCYGAKVRVTGDHCVFAMKTVRNTYYRRQSKFRKKLEQGYIFKKLIGKNHYKLIEGFGPDWVKSDTLKKGDFLIFPVINEIEDIKTIRISDNMKGKYHLEEGIIRCNSFYHESSLYEKVMKDYLLSPKKGRIVYISNKYGLPVSTVYQWVHKQQKTRDDIIKLKDEIPVDSNFMRLLGYYLAEGSGVSDHQIRFTFNSKETEYIKDVKRLIKKIFGIKVNKDVFIRNATNICISSRLLMDFFKSLVGNNAIEKRLPQWVLYLPQDKQKELINGYWRGDGCKSEYGFQFDTASLVLAEQIKLILSRLGFIPTFRTVAAGRKNPKYVVEVFGEKLKDFCDIVGEKHNIIDKRSKSYNRGWNDGNYLFVPINKIEKEHYDGLLYNLEIEKDSSYSGNYCVLHNCGRGTLADRQQKLNKHLHVLLRMAQKYNIAVYITNQVMAKPDTFFGDPTEAVGGHILHHASTYRVYLRRGKKGSRVAKLVDAPALPDAECCFMVTEEGLKDIE